jgi:hypothetical protein
MALTMQQMVDEVSAALDAKLRVRGRTLEAQVRKAGRLLPRGVKRDATYLMKAAPLAANPKLARMVDMTKAKQAHRNVLAFLEGFDLGARRRTAALNLVASIAFALMVTGILLLFVLVQRGFV